MRKLFIGFSVLLRIVRKGRRDNDELGNALFLIDITLNDAMSYKPKPGEELAAETIKNALVNAKRQGRAIFRNPNRPVTYTDILNMVSAYVPEACDTQDKGYVRQPIMELITENKFSINAIFEAPEYGMMHHICNLLDNSQMWYASKDIARLFGHAVNVRFNS